MSARRAVAAVIVGLAVALAVTYGLSSVLAIHEVPSGSMEPTIEADSTVLVVDRGGYDDLEAGTIVVYRADGADDGDLVVHRIVTWVDADEDWATARGDTDVHAGTTCSDATYCPAPHGGYITRGDANPYVDQTVGLSEPVEPDWIEGVYRPLPID